MLSKKAKEGKDGLASVDRSGKFLETTFLNRHTVLEMDKNVVLIL